MKRLITLLSFCLSLVIFNSAQLEAGVVGHFTFDNAGDLYADSSGLGNNGNVLTGAPTQDLINTVSGGSLNLNGSSSVEINAIADDVGTANHTLSVWFRSTDISRPAILSANTDSGGNSNMIFMTSSATAYAQVFSDPPGSFIAIADDTGAGDPVVNDGTFHHVAWVKDGTQGQLYVDGVLRVTTNDANYVRSSDDQWSIGQDFDGGSFTDYFTGQIDDVQIYDNSLSASDVAFLFNNPGVTVPEPSSILLLIGTFVFVVYGFRRKAKAQLA